MSKHIEKLKKQLVEVAEVVNSFKSEAVQVRIIDRLLEVMIESEKGDAEGGEMFGKKVRKLRVEDDGGAVAGRKKPGATQRSISSIANYCKDQYDSDFKTSELSGILLKLANENKLRRERSNENNRFEYIRA
jgi:hypothetical protein